MRKFEKILAIIFFTATVLKFFQVLGSSILVTIASCLLMILYSIFGFALFNGVSFSNILKKSAYTGIKPGQIITAILSGYFISCTVAAILFVVMMWPGVRYMIAAGCINLAVVTFLNLLLYLIYHHQVYRNILIRIGVILAISILLVIRLYFITDIHFD